MRRWARAWAALCVAFAIHVIDEAANDFLSSYNPNALALRARVPWLPVPVFTFAVWIAGDWLAPGVYSAPLLLASALWLLYETDRVRRLPAVLRDR